MRNEVLKALEEARNAKTIGKSLEAKISVYADSETVEKNRAYHEMQFSYLRNKISQQVTNKHEVVIRQFDTLQAELVPNGGYQERVYSPYQYLNVYGPTLIDDLLELPMSICAQHQVISF